VIDLRCRSYGAVLVIRILHAVACRAVASAVGRALAINPIYRKLRFPKMLPAMRLCANICPEDAITLKTSLNLTARPLPKWCSQRGDPSASIECGSLFGVKSPWKRSRKAGGQAAMFASSGGKSKDDSRVRQFAGSTRSTTARQSASGKERPRTHIRRLFSKRKDTRRCADTQKGEKSHERLIFKTCRSPSSSSRFGVTSQQAIEEACAEKDTGGKTFEAKVVLTALTGLALNMS